ncbi:MAG: hypothetical protein C0432_02680 [Candidatus Puniceispirillum sp.]|nr:hypothetical protein [Candidatus Pelagibacter sp.]MBA4283181.1 hypothetical protein [Candidatus Puniceispirillum sp.]
MQEDTILNEGHLNMLKSILDKQKFGDLLDLYVKDSERLIQECRQAIQQEKWQDLFESAHALKGSSANLGVMGVSDLAKSLELAAKDHNKILSLSLMGNLSEIQKKAISELDKLR